MSSALVPYSAADYLKDRTSSDRDKKHIFDLYDDTFVDVIIPFLDVGDIWRLRQVRGFISISSVLVF